MQKILVSSCLLGKPVRYDGLSKGLSSDILQHWQQQGRLISFCPEVAGGLTTPRPPAEVQANRQVLTHLGDDVTDAFNRGAQLALQLCQQHGIQLALLKANSPSCGNQRIYNGQFNGTLIVGSGICAALLQQHGITVFNENQLAELAQQLQQRENNH